MGDPGFCVITHPGYMSFCNEDDDMRKAYADAPPRRYPDWNWAKQAEADMVESLWLSDKTSRGIPMEHYIALEKKIRIKERK